MIFRKMRINQELISSFSCLCFCAYTAQASQMADWWRLQSYTHNEPGSRFQHALQVATTGDVYVLDQRNIIFKLHATGLAPLQFDSSQPYSPSSETTSSATTQQIFLALTNRPDIFLCSRATACGVAASQGQDALWRWTSVNQSELPDVFAPATSQVLAAHYQHNGLTEIYLASQAVADNAWILVQVSFDAGRAVLKSGPKSRVIEAMRATHYIQPVYLDVLAGSDRRTGFGTGYLVTRQNRSGPGQTGRYVTRLGRFCAGSDSFRSYTEITLQCRFNDQLYTTATTAHLREDNGAESYLAVGFVKQPAADHLEDVQQAASVVCVYPLKEINQLIDREIELCYSEGSRAQLAWEVGREKPCRKDKTNATSRPTFHRKFCINQLDPSLAYTAQIRNGFSSGTEILSKTAVDWLDSPVQGLRLVKTPLKGTSQSLTGMFMADGVLYLKDQLDNPGSARARTLAESNQTTTQAAMNTFVFGNGAVYVVLQDNRIDLISVGCGIHTDACACQANFKAPLDCGLCTVQSAMTVCASASQCHSHAGRWSNASFSLCTAETVKPINRGSQGSSGNATVERASSSRALALGLEVGGPLAALVLLLAAYCAVCYCLRKKRLLFPEMVSRDWANRLARRDVPEQPGTEMEMIETDSPRSAAFARFMAVALDSIDRSSDVLRKGDFGVVYRGRAKCLPTCKVRGPTDIAVKCFAHDASELEKFEEEFRVLSKAGRHVNIVNLSGIVSHGAHYLLLEYCPYGDLLTYLRAFRTHDMQPAQYTILDDMGCLPQCTPGEWKLQRRITNEFLEPIHVSLCTHDLVKFCHQISHGMGHLVSRSIIHRDLAARNVLVAHGGVLKISDFGLAKHGGQEHMATDQSATLPVLWMSPEAILSWKFSQKSDVWSFGVLMWEIFSIGQTPFNTIEVSKLSPRCFADWLLAKHQMEMPVGTPVEIQHLMENCWSPDTLDRQDFALHETRLRQLTTSTTNEAHCLAFDADFNDIPKDYQALLDMHG